jgi:small nuclear ribonucleoprotein (snRNP)-like protein
MNELIKKRVKESIGKVVLIFLKNNFRYEGKIVNSDENYVELLDFKTSSYKIILIDSIKQIDLKI